MAPRKKRISFFRLRADRRGSALLEGALVMPLIVITLAGMTDWGLALYQYHQLSTATSEAMRQLIISRGVSKPIEYSFKPFSDWAETLKVTNAMVTIKIQDPAALDYKGWQSPACNDGSMTEAKCAAQISAAAGRPAQISASVPCTMTFTAQFAGLCPIKMTMVGIIE
jgi:Flp pilus assembly protein TadG